jgi:uncharacterized repeat protein (TIGR01451 family)
MNFFKRMSTRSKLAVVALVALTAVTIPVVAKAGPSPDRPTKVYSDGVKGFTYPVMNSFTNVPNIGDERTFFNGMYPDGKVFSDPMPEVKNGDTLTLEVYVHNNADPSLGDAGTAKNTAVKVALPTGTATKQEAVASISSSNTTPQVVSDTLDMCAANGGSFALSYVPGSAHIKGNYIDSAVSDSIVTTGAPIGTDKLDGNVKGCFQQMILVTLQVKVKMPADQVTKQVRAKGAATWNKTLNAKAGDTAQWLVTFKNTGDTALNNVYVVDQVPAGLTVVPGSVKLINGNYPNGFVYGSDAIQDNGRTINVSIGNYNPGILAYVEYDTKVNAIAPTQCSAQTLTNKAFATPQGFGAVFDTADVTVAGNTCVTPTPTPTPTPSTPVYSCNLLTVSTDNASKTVTVTDFSAPASNGAVLKNVVLNWGDGTTPLTTNTPKGQTHHYPGTGPYAITAVAHFTTDGGNNDVTAGGASCATQVSFSVPTTPPTPGTPTQLVNTGAGSVVGIFAAAMVAGVFLSRLFLSRRLSRES